MNNWTRFFRNFFFYNGRTFYNLTGTMIEDFIRLSWNDLYSGEAEVTEVWQSVNSGEWTLAATVAPDAVTYDLYAPLNSLVRVHIRSVQISGLPDDWSDTLEFQTPLCYFVSNAGNDADDGLTPATAWATIAQVNTLNPGPNTRILFNRGDTWREQLVFQNCNGTAAQRIIIGAYGAGNKPRLLGSVDGEGLVWTALGGNVYSTPIGSFNEAVHRVMYDTNILPADMTEVALVGDLNVNWEFWYDAANNRIRVYHDGGSPETQCNGMEICGVFNENTSGTVVFLHTCQYFTIENLDVRYTTGQGISTYFSPNNTISACEVRYTYDDGINVTYQIGGTMGGSIIEDCYLFDVGLMATTTGAGGESIWLNSGHNDIIRRTEVDTGRNVGINGWGSDNLLIEECNVHDVILFGGVGTGNSAIYFDACTNSTMRRNYAEGYPRGFSINAETADTIAEFNLVHSNIAVNNQWNYNISYNIAVNPGGHVSDNRFINNTSFNDTAHADYGVGMRIAADVERTTVLNNIFVDVAGGVSDFSLLSYSLAVDVQILNYNTWYADHVKRFVYNNILYANYAAYVAASGQEANSLIVDPLFVGGGNYHLQALSPAIHVGQFQGVIWGDYDDTPFNVPPSMGGLEYHV